MTLNDSLNKSYKPTQDQIEDQKKVSYSIWKRINPGYDAYVDYQTTNQEDMINFKEEHRDTVDKTNFRKRDVVSSFVEATQRYKNLMKKQGAEGK
mmetsp:Transcript_3937/g.5818  ORF Transcript_3937/g.5818 Transcript_3937/m.5818 type:complete len:95 (+) Transcript_3937:36-320(+)